MKKSTTFRRLFTGAPPFRWEDAGLLTLRLWLCLAMLYLHGAGKLQKLLAGGAAGFPDPLGVGSTFSLTLAVSAEFLAATLLALGLLTRLAAIPLVVNMSVAFFVVHQGVLKGEHSGELAFIYLAGFVVLFLAGPGRWSLDRVVFRQ